MSNSAKTHQELGSHTEWTLDDNRPNGGLRKKVSVLVIAGLLGGLGYVVYRKHDDRQQLMAATGVSSSDEALPADAPDGAEPIGAAQWDGPFDGETDLTAAPRQFDETAGPSRSAEPPALDWAATPLDAQADGSPPVQDEPLDSVADPWRVVDRLAAPTTQSEPPSQGVDPAGDGPAGEAGDPRTVAEGDPFLTSAEGPVANRGGRAAAEETASPGERAEEQEADAFLDLFDAPPEARPIAEQSARDDPGSAPWPGDGPTPADGQETDARMPLPGAGDPFVAQPEDRDADADSPAPRPTFPPEQDEADHPPGAVIPVQGFAEPGFPSEGLPVREPRPPAVEPAEPLQFGPIDGPSPSPAEDAAADSMWNATPPRTAMEIGPASAVDSAVDPFAGTRPGGSAGTLRNDPGQIHVVRRGDNFWSIAREHYGSSRYFSALVAYNQGRIPEPDKLRPGMKVLVPESDVLEQRYPTLLGASYTPGRAAPRRSGFYVNAGGQPMYRVGRNDTLGRIAQLHLGRASRWTEIFALNRDRLQNANRLQVGLELRLPADASASRIASEPATVR